MSTTNRRRPLLLLALLLVVLAGCGYWWWSSTRPGAESTAVSASGEIETREYQIAPALAGRVTRVRVAEGDRVTKGEDLVELDRTALNLQLDQAKQGVVAATAAVATARDTGTHADVVAARARQAQARAEVALAIVQLGYATVTAPRDGVVTSVITNPAQNAAPGRTLLTLVDPSDLYVRVYVPETRLGDVHVGQPAVVTTGSGAQTFAGSVVSIASDAEFTPNTVQTDEQRATLVYAVRVQVTDRSGTLKAGMPVDVTVG